MILCIEAYFLLLHHREARVPDAAAFVHILRHVASAIAITVLRAGGREALADGGVLRVRPLGAHHGAAPLDALGAEGAVGTNQIAHGGLALVIPRAGCAHVPVRLLPGLLQNWPAGAFHALHAITLRAAVHAVGSVCLHHRPHPYRLVRMHVDVAAEGALAPDHHAVLRPFAAVRLRQFRTYAPLAWRTGSEEKEEGNAEEGAGSDFHGERERRLPS